MGLMEFQAAWVIITSNSWNIGYVRFSLLSQEAEITWTTVWGIRMFGETSEPKQRVPNNLTVASLETILRKSHHLAESFSPRWQLQLKEEATLAISLIQEMKDIFSDSRIRFIVEKVSDVPGADFVVNQWLQLAVILSCNSLSNSVPWGNEQDQLARRLLKLSTLLIQTGLEIQAIFYNLMKPFIIKFRKLRRILKQYKSQIAANQELISIFQYSDVTISSLAVIVQCVESKASYTISVDNKIVTVEWQDGSDQFDPTAAKFSLEVGSSSEVALPLLESILKHTLDRIEDVKVDMNNKLPRAQTVASKLVVCMKKLISQVEKQHKMKRVRISACSLDTRQAIISVEMSLKDLYKMLLDVIRNMKRVVGVADVMNSKLVSVGGDAILLESHPLLPVYSNHLARVSSHWFWKLGKKQKIQGFREGCLFEAEYLMSRTLLSKHAKNDVMSVFGTDVLSPELLQKLLLYKDVNSTCKSKLKFTRSIPSRDVAREDVSVWSLPEGPLVWNSFEVPASPMKPIKSTFRYVNPSFSSKVTLNVRSRQLSETLKEQDLKSSDKAQDSSKEISAQLHEDETNKDNMQRSF